MKQLFSSIKKLDRWIREHEFKGYEPFDGLSSYFYPLTGSRLLPMQILQQIVRRCPFHIRPIIGVSPMDSTKGRGYIAKGYLKLFQATGEQQYLELALECLAWLEKNVSRGYTGACWGNHFNYAARGGFIPKGDPTIVWTALIGHAFLDAYDVTNENKYWEMAHSACDFIIHDLPKENYDDGSICIGYVTPKMLAVHNSNLLGASLVARVHRWTRDQEALELARRSVLYGVNRQVSDGSWYYGEAKTYHWIDNWHTAYNLDALKWYLRTTDSAAYSAALSRGYEFYKNNFFLKDGTPKYYAQKVYPIDIQCAAQSIDTLSFFSDEDPESLTLASKIARWTIDNMQDKSGYFYFRKTRFKNVKIPMIHWGQATMLSALSNLYLKLTLRKNAATIPVHSVSSVELYQTGATQH